MISMASWVVGMVVAGPVFDPGPITAEDGDVPREIEVSRIQRHLSNVESTLRALHPEGLTDAQAAAREQSLDVLHDYWQAGVFPKNRDYTDRRVPYFIDSDGVACAVGHLMVESGDDELAREIATYENNDFVADIEHPGVGGWLDRNGFAAWEAAWIQPQYGPCGFEFETVCGDDGISYICQFVALECAGNANARPGLCDGDTEADIVGEEICEGGDGTASGESTGGGGDSTGGGSAEGSSSGGESAEEHGEHGDHGEEGSTSDTGSNDDGDDDKGCTVGGSASWTGLLALGLLGLRRRRRR